MPELVAGRPVHRTPADAGREDTAAADPSPTVSLTLHWLGHSTVLLQLPGLVVLTDPLFRKRLGPLRRHGPVPDPASLPVPDVVLLSHAHPDHFDAHSLRRVPGQPLVLVPRGMAPSVHRTTRGLTVREVRIGEVVEVGDWSIHAVRARHWRWPFTPRARSIGYLVDGPLGVYFAGDTGEFSGMKELTGRVDLALLPIARWGPQPTPGHLTPESAARVVAVIAPRVVLPIHWGTLYPAGLDRVTRAPVREPADRFGRAVADAAPGVEVPVLRPGDTAELLLPSRPAEERGRPSEGRGALR